MLIVIAILYILLTATAASWFYWQRINSEDHNIDHDYDGIGSILVGIFFPLTLPFAMPFYYLKKLKERKENVR